MFVSRVTSTPQNTTAQLYLMLPLKLALLRNSLNALRIMTISWSNPRVISWNIKFSLKYIEAVTYQNICFVPLSLSIVDTRTGPQR